MITIDHAALANVSAGADTSSAQAGLAAGANTGDKFGRCGPGTGMSFLGDVYTPQCVAHDTAVRNAEAGGDSKVMAHLKALPLLPAAIGSYIGARA